MATSVLIFAPQNPIPNRALPEEKMAAIRWEKRLSEIIHYRSDYKEIKSLKKGGTIGYIANKGKLDDFNLGEFSDELVGLTILGKQYPGDYLAIWTFGHAIHTFLLRSSLSPVPKEISFRLVPPLSIKRSPEVFAGFCSWFEGSAFSPDFKALEQEYMGTEISVVNWIKAFGVTGAKEIKRLDSEFLWEDFEKVALLLLSNKEVPASLLKNLNEELKEKKLPKKRKASNKPGEMARMIADIEYDLREVVGESENALWKERNRAAHFYWDITDDQALQSLTVGLGMGELASLGRLLAHYPVEIRRDPIFLALAGIQAESANGHVFVESFFSFAECVHEVGFTLAIYPYDQRSQFWEWCRMDPESGYIDMSSDDSVWAADLFLPFKKIVPGEQLKKWFEKQNVEGLILDVEADGSYRLHSYTEEIVLHDKEKLESAVKIMDIPQIFSAFGLPDLLKPGEWQEGSYSGEKDNGQWEDKRRDSIKRCSSLPAPVAISSVKDLLELLPKQIRFRTQNNSQEQMVFRLLLPAPDDAFLRSLAKDFKLRGLTENYGDVWVEGNALWATTYSEMITSFIVRIMGSELPSQSTLFLDAGKNKIYHYEIRTEPGSNEGFYRSSLNPSGESQEESSKKVFGSYNGIPEYSPLLVDVLLETKNRIYFKVDLAGEKPKDEKKIDILDKALQDLGMIPLGDFLCNQLNNIIVRGYAHEEFYAVIMLPIIEGWTLEFANEFEDDTFLTTTTNLSAGILAVDKITYQKVNPKNYEQRLKILPWEMRRLHREQMEIRKKEGKKCKPIQPTLLGLVETMESCVKKQLRES